MDWNAVSVDRYSALMNEDPRMPAFRGNPYRPLHCRMVVSEKKLHASRTYQERSSRSALNTRWWSASPAPTT